MIEAKIWGRVKKIISKEMFEVNRIEIVEGGYCSEHKHQYKYNGFFVESGKLKITTWNNGLVQHTILSDGDYLQVEPNVLHKFDALSNVVCYEIYWVQLLENDIQRVMKGGVK